MAVALLRVRDLRSIVGDRALLNVGEFALRHGEVLTLRGKNGAGKTTLLRILAGLERPDRAHISMMRANVT